MDDEAKRIYAEHVAKALEAAKRCEGELVKVYAQISNRIKTRIRKSGLNTTVFEVHAAIDQEFARTVEQRTALIHGAVGVANDQAPVAAERTVRLVKAATKPPPTAKLEAGPNAVMGASRRIAARTSATGNVQVSSRIRHWDADLGGQMAAEVTKGIKQAKGILGAAKQIQKLDTGLNVHLPRYLQEVEAAARAGNLDDLKALTKHYSAYAKKKLGELQMDGTRKASAYSLRSATSKFLKDIEKAGPNGIDNVVDTYVKEKAAWHAKVIARTETVRAFRMSYVDNAKSKPGVVAFRWTVSPTRHKVPDICDVWAKQNAHGLGPGGYPADKLPHGHPNCLCSCVAIMDRDHFKRAGNPSLPKPWVDTKSPDAVGWLLSNPEQGRQIAGPTRWLALKSGVNVFAPDGSFLPVGALPSHLLAGAAQ